MSHLVLLELTGKHRDRTQYSCPGLSLDTVHWLFTLRLQPLFFVLIICFLSTGAVSTTLLGIPLKTPTVSLMSLALQT